MPTFVYFLIALFSLFLVGTLFMFFKYLNNDINVEEKIKSLSTIFGIFILSLVTTWFFSESSFYFKEVLNYKVTNVQHQEKWSEKVTYTVQVYAGSDRKGNAKYRTETRTRTDYHGPFYYAILETGEQRIISENEYNYWSSIWDNEKHISTKFGTAKWCDQKIDGRCFEASWNNKFEDIYHFPIISRYKNKVRKSNSVFKYSSTYEDFGKHPVELNNADSIITFGTSVSNNDIALLNKVNAYYGYRKEIHIITVLIEDRDVNVVGDIINSWKGLNKNELVVFIGVDKYKNIKWCKVQSWLDNTKLHGIIEDGVILSKQFDSTKIKNIYMDNIMNNWERKSFKDFDYIRQSTEPRYYVIAFVIFIVFSLVQIIACAVLNNIKPKYYQTNGCYYVKPKVKKKKTIKSNNDNQKSTSVKNGYVKIRKW